MGKWLAAAGLTAIILPMATLTFCAVYLQGELTMDRLLVATWPLLIVLATLSFAWQATGNLLTAEKLLLDLAASPDDRRLIRMWRQRFAIRKQFSVASVIAVLGTSITAWLLWRGGVGGVVAVLYVSAVLLSAFLGGLGFYVGAWSPSLSYTASRGRLALDPLAPGGNEDLKMVAALYGKIVFGGVIVGIVLCSTLLAIALRYVVLRQRPWTLLIVVMARITVAWVIVIVHYHFNVSIMKARRATRRALKGLIEQAYGALAPLPTEECVKSLSALIDLDEKVRTGRSFALNFLLVLQFLASAAAAATPLIIEFIKKKLEIDGSP